MEKYNYKKKYGQNFLHNIDIINTIVNSVDIKEDDLILEIGPGSGVLTKELKKFNSKIIAFEIDTDLRNKLNLLEDSKTEIIYSDFLKINIFDYIKDLKYNKLYIIANLPYYITTPIIEKIIDSKIEPYEMILMVQKEVGERFIASPGNKSYGYFTVYLNNYFNVSKVIDVNKNCFIPVPKVDSMVVKFLKKEVEPIDKEKFIKLIHDSFQFKRKNIKNNLKDYDLNKIEQILNEHGITLLSRAEDIPFKVFVDIVKKI